MRSVDELTSNNNKPRLVPTFKQPERNLLSVFMSLIEIVPVVRGEFLKMCGYSSGRTCNYQSHMEVSYVGHKMPDVRPDGLFACQRGSNEWAAFLEAKAGKSPIRPEQIIEYLALATQVDVGTVITISNEFARMPTELPYHISANKRRKCDVYHFAWADIRTFLEGLRSNPDLGDVEAKVLSECLEFFWQETSGILTYDAMPPDWPKFVESSGTALGFGSKTPGITEIVHGWLQERRDLCSKLVHETGLDVDLGHEAGVRADKDLRLKVDRKMLADDYRLSAQYIFKQSKTKLSLLADLRACKTTLTLELSPPPNKKAKAVVNWAASQFEATELTDAYVLFDWKGRGQASAIPVGELLATPELAYEGQKDAPKSIQVIRDKHDVRRFKSRKLFIEDIETLTISTMQEAQTAGWLD